MEKSVTLFVCLSTLLSIGYALQCYKCESDTVEGCNKHLQNETCGLERPDLLYFCLFKVISDKKQQNKTIVRATCEVMTRPQLRPDKDQPAPEPLIVLDRNIQQCGAEGTYKVERCDPCKQNLCNLPNSASITTSNLLASLCLPLLYYFIKFALP